MRGLVLVDPEVPDAREYPEAAGAPVEEELVPGRLEQRCLPLYHRIDCWVHGRSGEAGAARVRHGAVNSG